MGAYAQFIEMDLQLITQELLDAGARRAGAYTRRQIELLGLEWPPKKGWKTDVIGKSIMTSDAKEFVELGGVNAPVKRKGHPPDRFWCGSSNPSDIYLYVLELVGGNYYVGLSKGVNGRYQDHLDGKGAEWTKQYAPLRIVHSFNTGTHLQQEAEVIEDESTIAVMVTHGVERVRGGHFSMLSQVEVERLLNKREALTRIQAARLDRSKLGELSSWQQAIEHFLETALQYYDAGAPPEMRDQVFRSGFQLTRYSFWRESLAPGLSWAFWGPKGVLPVLLTFQTGRPVASRLRMPYEVLAAAITRGDQRFMPFRRLFLLSWLAFQPPSTDKQHEAFLANLKSSGVDPGQYMMDGVDTSKEDSSRMEKTCVSNDWTRCQERSFDEIVSILFPQTRTVLRQIWLD